MFCCPEDSLSTIVFKLFFSNQATSNAKNASQRGIQHPAPALGHTRTKNGPETRRLHIGYERWPEDFGALFRTMSRRTGAGSAAAAVADRLRYAYTRVQSLAVYDVNYEEDASRQASQLDIQYCTGFGYERRWACSGTEYSNTEGREGWGCMDCMVVRRVRHKRQTPVRTPGLRFIPYSEKVSP